MCLGIFAILLLALPLLVVNVHSGALSLIEANYRTGSLVFGGGHVVLPLLEATTVHAGLVDHDTFLAGYGAAQALPGPLFTFAAFLGASSTVPPTGVAGAAIALIAIFLPGALLVAGVLPFWEHLRAISAARRVLAGVNAAVVGILAAALVTPVVTQGVTSAASALIAAMALVLLVTKRVPVWTVVLAAGVAGWILI